jgi:hypothetical protein
MKEGRETYLRRADGKLWGRPKDSESKYLLTSFVRCGECGSSITIRTYAHGRRARVPRYSCSGYHRRGSAVCKNGVQVPMDELDTAVLDRLTSDVLDPEVINAAVERAIERLAPGARESEVRRLKTELANVDAHPAVDRRHRRRRRSRALNERLRREEDRRSTLEGELRTAEHLVAHVDRDAIRREVERSTLEWRATLRAHVAQARQIRRRVLPQPITVTRVPEGLDVRGDAVVVGLIPDGPLNVASPAGVAPLPVLRGAVVRAA